MMTKAKGVPRRVPPALIDNGDGTMSVPLTGGRFARVDADDAHLVEGFVWHTEASNTRVKGVLVKRNDRFYARRNASKEEIASGSTKKIKMHTAIAGNSFTDHKDNDGLNNTRSNLRPSDHFKNGINVPVSVKSRTGIRGVHWDACNGRWRAVISTRINGKRWKRHIGYFRTVEEAEIAWWCKVLEVWGRDAISAMAMPPHVEAALAAQQDIAA